MDYTINEVLQFVAENDVKFVKLAFNDIFGVSKTISIIADELPRAFKSGVSFEASTVDGFLTKEEQDLFLFPDPATLAVLPWRPAQGRVVRFYCNTRHLSGDPFEGDGRNILKMAVAKAAQMGYTCKIGSECEFYLFEMDQLGNPTQVPHDQAGYMDIAPLDKAENVRREICLTLEEMGIKPESSHHEQGPGQNEIDFRYSDALTAADDLVTFKGVVRTIAARNGLFASFMPRPIKDQHGSGLRIDLSLYKNGVNLFENFSTEQNPQAQSFIAGIIHHIGEMTAFLNPITNSYSRFGRLEAPKYITWSNQNRAQLIRIPAAKGDLSRMELRSADPSCNPYLTFALLILAGMDGISNNMTLGDPSNFNLYACHPKDLTGIPTLPDNLGEALQLAQQSEFIKAIFPPFVLETIFREKFSLWENYCSAQDKDAFEKETYFKTV